MKIKSSNTIFMVIVNCYACVGKPRDALQQKKINKPKKKKIIITERAFYQILQTESPVKAY